MEARQAIPYLVGPWVLSTAKAILGSMGGAGQVAVRPGSAWQKGLPEPPGLGQALHLGVGSVLAGQVQGKQAWALGRVVSRGPWE